MVTDEDIKYYKDAEKKAWYYVENEVHMDMRYFDWLERKLIAEKQGTAFNEPEPKFDNRERDFTGLDMFNAFMRGYRLYEELRRGEFVMGLK